MILQLILPDLPMPKLFWVNPSSKSTTEQTEIVEFQWQAQTFPEVSNPREVGFDVGCEESVLLSCGMYMCNLNGE